MPVTSIVWYITGHGFGHASRSIEVINALADRRPDLRIMIRSQVAPWLIQRTVRPAVELLPIETDTGVVQIDSLRLDSTQTIERATAFMSTFAGRVHEEAAMLRDEKAQLVIADIPPLGIAAADSAGIASVALGNFTWDWIYEGYDGGQEVASAIGRVYARATLAIRLPMWGGFATMREVADVPFVARRSDREPAEVRAALGLRANERLVLVSFGGHGLSGLNVGALRRINGYQVLIPGDVNEAAMYEKGLRYEDLVHAVDVVVSKPGYGIISECAANGTALLYTSRGDFREYDVLVAAMPHAVRCGFIGHDDLFAGNWKPHLDSVLAQPRPAPVHADGAEVAADYLLKLLG